MSPPYVNEKNYIDGLPHIEELKGNDILTHVEKFKVNYKDKDYKIAFCHKAPQKRGSLPTPYSEFVNNFINVNHRFVRSGSVAVDIGAYDGDTSLAISILTDGGKVFAFECSPSFSSQLNINLGLNPSMNIVGCPYAVMEHEGIHQFLYSATDDNGGHPSTNSWVGTYTVPRLIRAVSFEKFLGPQVNFADISFIKIDTEGHDFHILWSFRDIIKEHRPVIHAEWFPRTHMAIKQLQDYIGYSMYCGYCLEPLTIYSEWRQDILLVPDEKIEEFKLRKL